MKRMVRLHADLPRVLRLGLATRGNTRLSPAHVLQAMDRGVNYLNWCGYDDGIQQAVAGLSSARRDSLVLACQFSARSAVSAERELSDLLARLAVDCLDVPTLYYVESQQEWDSICSPSGAMGYLIKAREQGKIRLLGLTTHQRHLAARWAGTGLLDLIMVRYNAAHRRAEEEVFPLTSRLRIPVVAFTCLRWGALLRPDPSLPGGRVRAPDWYRFVLANPHVAVALMAPSGSREVDEGLSILQEWESPDQPLLEILRRYGDTIRADSGEFP